MRFANESKEIKKIISKISNIVDKKFRNNLRSMKLYLSAHKMQQELVIHLTGLSDSLFNRLAELDVAFGDDLVIGDQHVALLEAAYQNFMATLKEFESGIKDLRRILSEIQAGTVSLESITQNLVKIELALKDKKGIYLLLSNLRSFLDAKKKFKEAA